MHNYKHLSYLSILLAGSFTAQAEITLSPLFSFNGTNGSGPQGTLIQAKDGFLYGTTRMGGTNNALFGGDGTIFRISTTGAFASLYSFSRTFGAEPQAPLVQGHDGSLYGTTLNGGPEDTGVLFKLAPDYTVSSLLELRQDLGAAANGLVQTPDGLLYGTLYVGSTNNPNSEAFGSIYKLTTNGVFSNLISFDGQNGANSRARLTLATDGNLYGTTFKGGTNGGWGTVFKLTPAGQLTTLVHFNGTNGAAPLSAPFVDQDGTLYGTTSAGGVGFNGIAYTGYGTVYKIDPAGTFSTVGWFAVTNGSFPAFGTLLKASDGALYGTTERGGSEQVGTVFKYTSGSGLQTVIHFSSVNGAEPSAGLVQASDGNLYGVTTRGGQYDYGTVFRLNLPVPQPVLKISTVEAGGFALSWNSIGGRKYQVKSAFSLSPPAWENFGAPITATSTNTVLPVQPGPDTSVFYRVSVEP